MLLVSHTLQIGAKNATTVAGSWLHRPDGLHADPIVAIKFWHNDCVFAGLSAFTNGAEQRIHSAKKSRKFSSVISGANFSSCTHVNRVNG